MCGPRRRCMLRKPARLELKGGSYKPVAAKKAEPMVTISVATVIRKR